MTPTGAIIAALVAGLFWYIGWKMQASISKEVIKYRENEIEDLKQEIEWYEKLLDSLYSEEDMKDAYYQGRNDELDVQQTPKGTKCTKWNPGDTFKKWLEQKYKSTETSEIGSWG